MTDRTIVEAVKKEFSEALFAALGRFPEAATPNDRYLALALAVRRQVMRRWVATSETYYKKASRTVCYLSAEFLLGPHLGNNLLNLGLQEEARQAMSELGHDLDAILAQEEEPGLGNGGLGRLAACYMDSLATLEIPTLGYGIRYEFGIFDQLIRDGWQVEKTDKWLALGNPWETPRPEIAADVSLGGHTEGFQDERGRYRVRWVPERVVRGVAYDVPILGYRNGTANLLRLWKAEATESFDFEAFNQGDYWRAVDQKVDSENITKVLYPNDELVKGKRLRLEQQYFFVSCSLQDMIRIYRQRGGDDLSRFHEKYAVQLNDTHPAVAVAELMRLLVDVHGMGWDEAWEITRRTFAYTNHTLLPEALEKWKVEMFGSVLPRHLEIVYEINRRFLDEVRHRYPGDGDRAARLSLIDEAGGRSVRMAHLASVGSHRINGVAALHTELLKADVLRDFHELWPEKFVNVTNGVTPRRFLALANPRLAALVTEAIGDGWPKDLERLRRLEPLAEDAAFRAKWRAVKRANKADLAAVVEARAGVACDPDSLFDVQVKRIHEYKRQHLNVLHVIALWQRLRREPLAAVPRADRPLRRQGRPRLPDGEAHDQARPLRGRGGERRPRHPRPPARGLHPGLQRQELHADLPGGGALRADLDRGQGGLRHRQHEVRHERGAHHRHSRRRERGDPRGGGGGELLPLRPHRRRDPRGSGPGATGRGTSTRATPCCGRWSTLSPTAPSRAATRRSSGPSWTRSSATTPGSSPPTSARTSSARGRWSAPTSTPSAGPGCRS